MLELEHEIPVWRGRVSVKELMLRCEKMALHVLK